MELESAEVPLRCLVSNTYCTACGTPLGGGKYCVSCGTIIPPKAPLVTPPPLAPPPSTPPRVANTQAGLRCVDCGSPIASGLACTRCASRSTPRPAAQSQVSGQHAAAKANSAWRVWLPLTIVGLLVMFLWANDKSHGRLAQALPTFGSGIDGTYSTSQNGTVAKLTISKGWASFVLSDGSISGNGIKVEQHGDTLKLSGGNAYENGYFSHSADPSPDLATIGDDGQSITLHLANGDMKFVKE